MILKTGLLALYCAAKLSRPRRLSRRRPRRLDPTVPRRDLMIVQEKSKVLRPHPGSNDAL